MGLETIIESPVHTVWKSDLYQLQLEAPVPLPVICDKMPSDSPDYLGRDYHGSINHREAAILLKPLSDGAYLVRKSNCAKGQFYTLSLKFNTQIHHFKLYFDTSSGLYVQEKKYDCVRSLVADGLISMYLELKAPALLQRLCTASYRESPFMTLNERKFRALVQGHGQEKLNQRTEMENMSLSDQILKQTIQDKIEKPHAFKFVTFKGLNWCELCANFLWGFTLQGKKCEDCGVIAHEKCSEKFPNDCQPDLKYIRGVFGIELTTLLTAYKSKIPFVVTKCVEEVEARGLHTEGLYRLSGFADEVDAIKLAFDKDGELADLGEENYQNIHVVTGALKLYLRLLPVPLITFNVHPKLIDATQHKDKDLQISSIKYALLSLPRHHYDTLKYVLEHLNRVSTFANINKMTAHNLATVFAPTLIHHTTSGMWDIRSDIILLEVMINNCDKIFLIE